MISPKKKNEDDMTLLLSTVCCIMILFKGAVSRNSAKLGNYKMPVKLREI